MANVLFIGGSLNQTTQLHQIAVHLSAHNCYFSPFYADGLEAFAAQHKVLESTVLGGRHQQETRAYLAEQRLPVDDRGRQRSYDLVVTCSDLIVPRNIRKTRLVLVQEGITVPEGLLFRLVRALPFLPRYLADTAATGLSDAYDLFCVASEGYRQLFIRKGVRPEKIAVTGIPNFDNFRMYLDNTFPLRGYVLVATTPYRETGKFENRRAFLEKCKKIAAGRQVIFKLHPLENAARARREITAILPEAIVLTHGNVNHMIANAEVVITQQSSCTYVALGLGKELYTDLNLEELRQLMPLQNGGDSARRIAALCERLVQIPLTTLETLRRVSRHRKHAPRWANRFPKCRWEPLEH